MINPREIPFVRWLLFFLIGIISAIYLKTEILYLDVIITSFFILGLMALRVKGIFKYWWILVLPHYIFFLLFGYYRVWQSNDLNKNNHFESELSNDSFIIGEIDGMPIKKKWVRLELNSKEIGTDSLDVEACSGKILTFIEVDSLSETLGHGDIILFKNPIFDIEPPKNPHAFNYKRFLSFQNIHFQTFVKSGDWQLLKKNDRFSFESIALGLRQNFLKILRKYLPTDDAFSVGSALILGYRDEISQDVQDAYADTGAMHVLAVSGLHVGIIYIILNFFLLNRIHSHHQIWKILKIIIPLIGIWGFALLTGMSPSVKRAAMMFSIFIIGTALQRKKNSYNTLSASAFIILLFDPYLIMHVGFQLSYLAVFGILYFQPRIAKLWMIKNRIGDYFWQLSSMSFAAQISTAPLGMFYFHKFSFSFLISGLIVIPMAFLILCFGLLLFLFESIHEGMGLPFGWILEQLINGVNWSIFQIQNMPGSVLKGIWISSLVTFLLYIVIGKTAIALEKKNFKWLLSALSIFMIISLGYSYSKYQDFQTRKIVIYNINRASAIDFFDGFEVISITNQDIDEKNLNFAVQNNRWQEGDPHIRNFFFEDSTTQILNRWMHQDGFIQFYDKKIRIISQPSDTLHNSKIELDYLLIQNNPKLKIESLLKIHDFDLLIFDASNSRWRIENWEEECRILEVPFYNIQEKGAFILDLNES